MSLANATPSPAAGRDLYSASKAGDLREVGRNVLHLASAGGHLEIVKLIVSLNVVNINARNNDGETAADWARLWTSAKVAEFLVSRGGH
ncbi:ankyrin repeat-containing protein P16F5.05c-like [Haliotis rubra]|uniref:ankyrin repeat-containing protein P16F5.05c-like n=1 Tax=Haliotis rubra TaxID=36100 RepID=UPI001EE5696E|nr:ankyrin repeat-containing protein P16F5.05c-like [Haliotis rubra]